MGLLLLLGSGAKAEVPDDHNNEAAMSVGPSRM